ncbi:hypothetical protein MYAM1_000727 [Malassezia yamatoensis]|uniref:ARM repeat-containing protein n=1 Tax=Malassezia yamatoensis TaxID=253288 RepID=A0AAJ6CHN1_9BASI|nr:hypothetical protein MYAM1_000727 [Malassezia yamatoensis]
MSTKADIVVELAREHGVRPGNTDLPSSLDALADELRSVRLRTTLGESALPAVCVQSLSDPEAASSALRVLANLCIDDDKNRDKILGLDIVTNILPFLNESIPPLSHLNLQLLKSVFGMLLNLQKDFEPAKKALRHAQIVPKVTELSASPDLYSLGAPAKSKGENQQLLDALKQSATAACWGLCLVEDLLETESDTVNWTREAVQALTGQEQSFRAATREAISIDATSNTMDVVSLELQILDSIGAILEHSSDSFFYALVHPSDGPLQSLLDCMTMSSEMPGYWQHALLDEELKQDTNTAIAKLRAGAAHAIIGAAGVDANLEQLCPIHHNQVNSRWFVKGLLKAIMSSDLPSMTCALLALGNLARDNQRSESIIEVPTLLPRAIELLDRQDTKLSYAILGFLNNLAVPQANKMRILNLGVLSHLAPMLERERDMIQPLQFAVIKLLRQLINTDNSPQILVKIVATPSTTAPQTLSSVAELLKRTDSIPLKAEIARLYTAILRSLRRYDSSDASLSGIEVQTPFRDDEAKKALDQVWAYMKQESVIDALVILLRHSRQHAVTMSEGLLGLAILSSKSSEEGKFERHADAAIMTLGGIQKSDLAIGEAETEMPFRSGLEAMVFVLDHMPPQVIGNACSLIQLWMNAAPEKSRMVLAPALLQSLKDCESKMPDDVRPSVSRAKALLMEDEI